MGLGPTNSESGVAADTALKLTRARAWCQGLTLLTMDSLKRFLAACCPCFCFAEPASVESVCLQVGAHRLDLNSASQTDLESLPSIGPFKAAAIVLHREKHGRFLSVDGLLAVAGIGSATVDKLRGLVCGSSGAPQPIVPPPPPPPLPSLVPAGRAGHHTVFFFPDGPLPCPSYLAGRPCGALTCKLAHRENGLTVLLHALARARATLDVAVYAISLKLLAHALRDARARGVRVRVLSDDEQARDVKSAVPQLQHGGVLVRTDRSTRYHRTVKAPSCCCHSSLPWPPEAGSPGSRLRHALGASGRVARGPRGGCGAAVRPDRSQQLCGVQRSGGRVARASWPSCAAWAWARRSAAR